MAEKIKTLCIISNKYPTANNPEYTFVDQLVCEFADLGVNCIVISPVSISKHIVDRSEYADYESIRETKVKNKIKVIRPRYFSFSNKILHINTSLLTYRSFKNTVLRELKKRGLSIDAIYGHFIFPSGMCAADIGRKLEIPSFLAYGESSPASFMQIKKSLLRDKLSKLNGIISVSSENKRELLELGIVDKSDKISVFVNGIDNSKFRKISKSEARAQLSIDNNIFVIAFLGDFIERKGITVLSDVLDQLDGVYSIFIGSGKNEPKCKNIIFKGRVPHDQVYLYLNAADVFVLPTLAEGCCNAIIEAMACGLPVISSDQPFNDDILNDENSLRVDVKDTLAIKDAITHLKNDISLRNKMAEVALQRASELSIKKRASDIISYMNNIYLEKQVLNVD